MNDKIKILYIIPAEGFGGAERQAIFHVSNLPKKDYEIISITGPGFKVLNEIKSTGMDVRYCASFPNEYAKPFNLFSYCIYAVKTIVLWIRSAIFLLKVIKDEKVDLIFACRVVGLSLAGPLSRICKIPYVWRFGSCVHGCMRRCLLRLFGKLFSPVDIIVNCQAVGESIDPLFNIGHTIVPNGIDLSFFQNSEKKDCLRRQLKTPENLPIVGLAVRPSPDKGMDFLKKVVKSINDPEKRMHFCIAGEFGWRKQIQIDFSSAGLSNGVSFLGHVGDIREFFTNCDIVALTSRNKSIEGFPNSLLEAMATGKPVVATNAGGIPELIENDRMGIIVNDGNPDTFAGELIKLAEDPIRRNQMGKYASSVVFNKYNPDVVITKLADTIKACVEKIKTSSAFHEKNTSKQESKTSKHLTSANITGSLMLLCSMLLINIGMVNCFGSTFDKDLSDPDGNNFKWFNIDANSFVKVNELSGEGFYYSIRSDSGKNKMIHAEYLPSEKTVKLGYKFPDTFHHIKKVSWDWRIIRPPVGSDESTRGKNDSGAAVYLVFSHKLQRFIIKYAFSNELPVGTIVCKDPFYPINRMYLVVASSLRNNPAGKWIHVEVNVESDFKKFYDSSNCPDLRGIGIMTDGDETKSHVVADYRNFELFKTDQ